MHEGLPFRIFGIFALSRPSIGVVEPAGLQARNIRIANAVFAETMHPEAVPFAEAYKSGWRVNADGRLGSMVRGGAIRRICRRDGQIKLFEASFRADGAPTGTLRRRFRTGITPRTRTVIPIRFVW